VRYVDIDYRRDQLAPGHRGPRWVSDEREWVDPTWSHPRCDSVDFGVELETMSGRTFSITWDSPGMTEGLGIDELPLLGSAVLEDAATAVWEVGERSAWATLIGGEVTQVRMHYRPWGEQGFWCSRISMSVGQADVEFLLAEGSIDGDVVPSAENVVVIHSPDELPEWERERDSENSAE
jgi:hypothetical protein